jgi:hypothetical protein
MEDILTTTGKPQLRIHSLSGYFRKPTKIGCRLAVGRSGNCLILTV